MADPTAEQLAGFFAAATQLRTIFGRVDIVFRGANTLPDVLAYWTANGPVVGKVLAESQSADEIIAAMQALYAANEAAGLLRNQLAAAEATVAGLRQQLGLK